VLAALTRQSILDRALGLLSFIPILGGLAEFIGGIWALAAGIVAIRQGLDFTTGKAIVTAIVGWLIWLVVSVGMILVFGLGVMTMGM
jgi:hypothetical protein